jgi:O-antigen/teichoic acid export membrane protein
MSNDKQVGIYNIAYKIGSVGFLVIVSVSTIITPKMAELFGKGNLDQLKKLTHNSTRLIAFLSLPIVLVLIFLSASYRSPLCSGSLFSAFLRKTSLSCVRKTDPQKNIPVLFS